MLLGALRRIRFAIKGEKVMACMEHHCRACKHCWFNNKAHESCLKCGSRDVQSIFDEPPEREEEYDDYDCE